MIFNVKVNLDNNILYKDYNRVYERLENLICNEIEEVLLSFRPIFLKSHNYLIY